MKWKVGLCQWDFERSVRVEKIVLHREERK